MQSLQIPGVILEQEIGRGAMGTVYAGSLAGRSVAVKVLDTPEDADAGLARAFRTEARAMATLSHPNIIAVLDVGTERTPYVVMERADASLAAACGRRGYPQVHAWLLELLDGLAHAHARGIIHRDLKPGNVLLARDVAKLADFGLARAFETVGAGDHERPAGTPGYMPPEQRQGRWRDLGPWTDLYALGRVALDLVTRPDGGTIAVPEGFAAWVSRLRQEEPRDRFQRAADARIALQSLALEPLVELDGRLSGSGPAPESALAMTEPYFEEQDQLTQALPEPMERLAVPFPEQPLPLHPAPVARRASMVGLRLGRPVGNDEVLTELWALARQATKQPVLVGLRGPGQLDLAMWLCHQLHATGVGTVDLVTHTEHHGPRSGLGGLLARELRALDLTPRRALDRVEALLVANDEPQARWKAGALASLMAPALAEGELPRVELEGPERHALVARFVALDAAGRLPLIWANDLQHGGDTRAWIASLLDAGAPCLIVATVPDAELEAWFAAHRAHVFDLRAPGAAACAVHLQQALGLTPEAAAPLAARCGTDVRLARLLLDGPLDATDDAVYQRCLDQAFRLGRDWRALGCAAALGIHVEGARWRDVCRRARTKGEEGLLEVLVAAGIAVPVGLGGTGDWIFGSPRLREKILDAVDPAPLHRACALAYPLDAETCVVRAHHLRLAGVPEAALRALTEAVPTLAARHDHDRLEGCARELTLLSEVLPEAALWGSAVRWALGGREPDGLPDGAGGLAVLAGEHARARGDDEGWMRALDLAEGLAAQAAATEAAQITWQRAAYLVRRRDPASVRAAVPILLDAIEAIDPARRGPPRVELAFAYHLLGDREARDAVLATTDAADGSWLAQLIRGLQGAPVDDLLERLRRRPVTVLQPLLWMLEDQAPQ